MLKPNWRPITIVVGKKTLKNRWHCLACGKHCIALLPIDEMPPNANCEGVPYET